jgi:hypothetical protein
MQQGKPIENCQRKAKRPSGNRTAGIGRQIETHDRRIVRYRRPHCRIGTIVLGTRVGPTEGFQCGTQTAEARSALPAQDKWTGLRTWT